MSFAGRLVHTLVIERATSGTVDADGQPTRTYAAIATVPGLIEPKSVLERAQANQAGVVIGDYTIHVYPTDVAEADYILDATGRVFQIRGIRNYDFGGSPHLELDALEVAA